MTPYSLATALDFARICSTDPFFTAAERDAMQALLAAHRSGQDIPEQLIDAVRGADARSTQHIYRFARLAIYIESVAIVTAIADRATVVIAADSATANVRVNGQLLFGATCPLGRGMAALPTRPLHRLARRYDALLIEVRHQHGWTITPVHASGRLARPRHFDDQGRSIEFHPV